MRCIAGDSRTRITVQIGGASALASKRGSIDVEGALECIGAIFGEIDTTFRGVAGRSRRGDLDRDTETLLDPNVVKVTSIPLTQSKVGEGNRGSSLFSRRNKRQRQFQP